MKTRNIMRAMAIAGVVMAVMGAAVPVGHADHGGPAHVVCVRVYYESPPGTLPHDIVNECRVGTTLTPGLEDFYCETFQQPISIRLCYWYQISTP